VTEREEGEMFEDLKAAARATATPQEALEYVFSLMCVPGPDEYLIASVDRNTGLCEIEDVASGERREIALSRLRFKTWRHSDREPGYPGDIVALKD
jgi:hypothetical protein